MVALYAKKIIIAENKSQNARIMPWFNFSGSGSGPSTVHCLAGAMIVQHPPALGHPLSSTLHSKAESSAQSKALRPGDLRVPAEMTFATGTG